MNKSNRDLSNWVGRNIHIDDMNKAIIAVRVRGLEDVIAQLKTENILALAQMDEAIDEYGKAITENEGLKNNLRVILTTNDDLRDTIRGLRKLAHDYITAYEKLAFGDPPSETPISDVPITP